MRRRVDWIASRFLRHARFRDRPLLDGDKAYWERDPHFDVSFHVRRTALPRPAGKQELQDLGAASEATPSLEAEHLQNHQH